MRVPGPPPLVAALLLAIALLLLVVPDPVAGAVPAGAARPARVEYRLPVPGAVLDPFRPPATPYGPGNRGLDLAADPGTPVAAAAPGVVDFAGPVAGSRYVTLRHADRLRTTYGPLASVVVVVGATVDAGEPVGTAGGAVLWTVRAGDAYLDPAVLLAASGRPRVHLVPTEPVGGAGDTAGRGGPAGGEEGRGGRPEVPVEAAEWGLGRS